MYIYAKLYSDAGFFENIRNSMVVTFFLTGEEGKSQTIGSEYWQF